MPDMEKCIALCTALDLNIEYLALGKEVAPPAPSAKKRFLWLGAAFLAFLCFGAGFLFGRGGAAQIPLETTPQPDTTSAQQQVHISGSVSQPQQAQVSGPVSDFSAKPINKSTLELTVLPAVLTEGMEIHLVCEDKILGTSQTHTCTFDGTFYRLRLPRTDNYRYYITAILERNGAKEQIPLAEISGDEYSCLTLDLWKG